MTGDARLCTGCQAPLFDGTHFCPHCGRPTPTDAALPPRTGAAGASEIERVRAALHPNYRIERVLGEGGMATVYLAEDLKHNRQVAVKVMRPELAESLGTERFLREVEIAAKLSHPNILAVHDSGAANGILYYTMPLVEGESLPARLHREKQLPVAEAVRLVGEVAEALAYAHKRGVIHRDIKPANILIHEGHALVADFGIARATSDSAALTKTGLAIGTPSYMSPEQASGEPHIDGRSDLYALGCVLYEMLAGEPPFTGPTAQAIITRSITEKARPLTHVRAGVSAAIDAVTQKALAKSPADRFATATEMAEALATAVTQENSPPQRVEGGMRRGWKIGAAAVATMVVLAAAVLIGLRWTPGTSEEISRSVAVLPFKSMGSADDAYFADGIVEELRDRLTRIDKLTVIASASADQYRGSTKLATEIAKELRVDHVLTGTVRWGAGSGGAREFRVTTELVDGKTGKVTWRDGFDGSVKDPLTVQGEIATRVAGALGAALGEAGQANLAGRATQDPEAYALYLKGMAIGIGGEKEARDQAAYFESAVALDPNYFRAWVGLTSALAQQYNTGSRDTTLARRARHAMERTIALGQDSSLAHWAASNYYTYVAQDDSTARREAQQAYRLDPRNPRILVRMARYDREDGNNQAMFEKLAQARDFDPLNKRTLNSLVIAQLSIRQYAEAKEVAKELEAMRPLDLDQIRTVAMTYLSNNDLAGAKRAVAELSKDHPGPALVAYLAGYEELAFVLSDEQRQLIYRLTPTAFEGDRAWWGQSLATTAWQQGDKVRAAAWADSSLLTAQQQLEASPHDAQRRILNAVSLAMVGQHAAALREAEIAIADTIAGQPAGTNYVMLQYARVQTLAGKPERAIAMLRELTGRLNGASPSYLRIDPSFRPLAGQPGFEQLTNRGIGTPVD